jgi:hypothetical protein
MRLLSAGALMSLRVFDDADRAEAILDFDGA